MYNEDVLKRILKDNEIEDVAKFCKIFSEYNDIKYQNSKSEKQCEEFDYERDWWNQAYLELTKTIILE